MKETTIIYPASCFGLGVHSGQKVQVTLKPAKAGTGIVFVRTDIRGDLPNFVKASFEAVSKTKLCTTISSQDNIFSISTVEHLMAGIWGCGIDNLIVEIDGPEVPIMDGSSRPFVFMIECAQTKILKPERKKLKIKKEVYVEAGESVSIASPDEKFSISLNIDFNSKAIGRQSITYSNRGMFSQEVASARTFGFLHELEYLQSIGLAKGVSLDNSIGLDKDIILNHDGLRFKDEFVRHKLLDAIGDFALANCDMIGSFSCTKPGHYINNLLLRKIFSDPNNYSIVDES
ncbi:MAG: UDP-3-O-[3-hydroxymyristoyl] N-acetylglucosamine deacetylase [Alphaproteobacteria bacterium]|nr:UDP-3-O-[3-hydroxymyristoyl] N-acetylglucosamine deacetylase [Alphaproteobacteria bacterium]